MLPPTTIQTTSLPYRSARAGSEVKCNGLDEIPPAKAASVHNPHPRQISVTLCITVTNTPHKNYNNEFTSIGGLLAFSNVAGRMEGEGEIAGQTINAL